MNCREFRRKHDAYVDDTLSGTDLEAMGRHLRFCEPCAQRDTRVRRSLLIARNLPTIEPSAAFSERLQMRLAHERVLQSARRPDARDTMMRHEGPLSAATYVALAAGLAMAAGLMLTLGPGTGTGDQAIRLAPVVASLPEPARSPLATPAMVASMPVGMPIWPAMFVADRETWQFASDLAAR